MTNKTNLLLVAFMAIFLFSCAAEDPTTSSFGSAGNSADAPKAGAAFTGAFEDQREEIDTGGASWKTVPTTTVEFLANSFLVTKIGNATYAALYIKPLGTGAYNSGNADLTYASDASSLAKALANSGAIDSGLGGENEQQHTFYDPRKLLTSEGRGLRMAWSGKVANPPEPSDTGSIIGFAEYNDYDTTYSSALGGTSTSYSIVGTWQVHTYGEPVKVPLGDVTTYVKSIDGSTRAWFWFLNINGTRPEHYSTVSDPGGLGFGSGTTADDSDKEPRYTSGTWDGTLNTADTDTHNNVDPPGKMLFGRKTGAGISSATYTGSTAVFLSTVVGYNIRIKEHDVGLANTLYPEDGGGIDAEGIASVHEYYMEFDAASSIDAKNDNYNNQRDFPHWGGFYESGDESNSDNHDGDSITGSVKVQKFTGILLKMK